MSISLNESTQFMKTLSLKVNARVVLVFNVNTPDGLVNGAMGTIRDFTKTERGEIHIIWVEFDNNNVGEELRKCHSGALKS